MLKVYMMTLTGVALAQIAPGPNLLAVAGVALGHGTRPALFVTLGVATAVFAWMTLTTFGLATLLALYPPLLTVMKIAGGVYLCFIALKALRSAFGGTQPGIGASHASLTPAAAWRRGLLVNMTNPKSALTWAAITTFMFGAGLSTSQVLGFAPVGAASALVVYGTYATLFSTNSARRIYARFTRPIEAAFGVAFGALGGSLIVDGLRDLSK